MCPYFISTLYLPHNGMENAKTTVKHIKKLGNLLYRLTVLGCALSHIVQGRPI